MPRRVDERPAGMLGQTQVRLTGGDRPPEGAPRLPSDVPGDAELARMTPSERERLVVGLGLSAQEHPDDPAFAEAARRVLSSAPPLALRLTLETAAQRQTLGFITSLVGLEPLLTLGEARGLNVNDVLATTDTVRVRGLTTAEARRVRDNFKDTLDPRTVRMNFTTGAQTMGAGALVLGNVVHVDPTFPQWNLKRGTTLSADPSDERWGSYNSVILGHELAHVWSYQHQGSQYAINSVTQQVAAISSSGDRDGAYAYTPGRPSFWAYGEEQRAMVVQDYLAAQQARRLGHPTALTRYGGALPVDDVIRALEPYYRQMIAAGPGVPSPGPPQPVTCVPTGGPGFRQDGVLDAVARSADAVIATAGRASTQAVVEGLKTAQPGKVAAGAAGVAAAVAASIIPREQNAYGATGGGSAVLDQAGIPHGVELTRGPVSVGVEADWDAPAPRRDGFTVGLGDPRLTASVGVAGAVGDAEVSGQASATMGLDGTLRDVRGGVHVRAPVVELEARGSYQPAVGLDATRIAATAPEDRPFRADGVVAVTSAPVSATASAVVQGHGGQVDRVEVQGRADLPAATLAAGVRAARARPDAPLAVEEVRGTVSLEPSTGVALGVDATVTPAGLEELAGHLTATSTKGSLSVQGYGRQLTTQPTVGVQVTATDAASGVTVGAQVESTPSTGAVEGGVTVKVPF